MFRIVCDPSSGSTELCLTEITLGGSQIFFMCLVGVWQHNFEPVVCALTMHGTHTHRRFKMTCPYSAAVSLSLSCLLYKQSNVWSYC